MSHHWSQPGPLRPGIAAKVRCAVLFDVDGTLVDARGTSSAMVQALGEAFQTEINADDYYMGGRTDAQIAVELLERNGIGLTAQDERLGTAWNRYLELLDAAFEARPPMLYDGVWEVLERLARDDRMTVGLLTGNQRQGAFRKLCAVGIDGYFLTGAFGDESDARNELPALALQRIARLLRRELPAEQVIIVGDTPADIECAHHAGCRALAVATGRHDLDTLSSHNPDVLFENLTSTDEVLGALQALARA